MPPILHGVDKRGTVAVLCDWLGIAPASGGYGLSAEAQLHRYASIRNIQGGGRRSVVTVLASPTAVPDSDTRRKPPALQSALALFYLTQTEDSKESNGSGLDLARSRSLQ